VVCEHRQRCKSQAEYREARQNDAACGEAVEQQAERGRTGRNTERGEGQNLDMARLVGGLYRERLSQYGLELASRTGIQAAFTWLSPCPPHTSMRSHYALRRRTAYPYIH
jgi:hypothetical protein